MDIVFRKMKEHIKERGETRKIKREKRERKGGLKKDN